MRILQIRFKNLNSLVGEWEIDLTHPAFISDGIFAITGPTGAGKTTILDAICLALYGRTPRLNRVTKSGNEIMSRQTGECFAEVVFETQAGRFRCHWSQHRARKKPDGELQPPRQEIADADSGVIFEAKLRGVAEQIELATGMDFDRFTRSMLLAQGGFATFLQAAPDDRAPILEQITGTEIYSHISIGVHKRRVEEKIKLDLLQAEFAGMHLFSEAQEQQFKLDLELKTRQEADLNQQLILKNQAVAWLDNLLRLEQESRRIEAQQHDLFLRQDIFKRERDKLARANQALELSGEHVGLLALRREQDVDQRQHADSVQALPMQITQVKPAEDALKHALDELDRNKIEQKRTLAVIRTVRELDLKYLEKTAPFQSVKQSISDLVSRLQAMRLQHDGDSAAFRLKRCSLDDIAKRLDETSVDEGLVEHLTGIRSRFDALKSLHERHRVAVNELNEVSVSITHTTRVWAEKTVSFDKLKHELQAMQESLVQKQTMNVHDLVGLRASLLELKTIQRFEVARQQLKDGEACPLCGAEKHPFAEGNIPLLDETAIQLNQARSALNMTDNTVLNAIQVAETLEKEINTLREVCDQTKDAVIHAERETQTAAHQKEMAAHTVERVKKVVELLLTEIQTATSELLYEISGYGMKALTPDVLVVLTDRRNQWLLRQKKKMELEQGILSLDIEIQHQLKQIAALETDLEKQQKMSSTLERVLNDLAQERRELYGDKNPDHDEIRLSQVIEATDNKIDLARQHYTHVFQELARIKHRIEELERLIDVRQGRLKMAEDAFQTRLHQSGFADEMSYLGACLSEDERKKRMQQALLLDTEQMELEVHRRNITATLETERQKQLTVKPIEELKRELTNDVLLHRDLQHDIGGLRQILHDNDSLRLKQQSRVKAIENQKKECARWTILHDLIGSVDGKKYRNFAQGLTFDMMIGHANRQLLKMTDRYLLSRDESQPLELNVIDNYQAGEVRSTKNLSGGESFIVSLCLALGLSQMSSHNVRVDSLFLDEGFGTLDDDALDTALETLAGLQQDGKLIGMISHVPAIKERISTQIRVTPKTGGRSVISGFGCRLVENLAC